MIKLKFKKIAASVLSLSMTCGLFTGIISNDVSASTRYNGYLPDYDDQNIQLDFPYPDGYDGLGYFADLYSETGDLQVVQKNYHNHVTGELDETLGDYNFGVTDCQARIIKRNNKYYLRFGCFYEIHMRSYSVYNDHYGDPQQNYATSYSESYTGKPNTNQAYANIYGSTTTLDAQIIKNTGSTLDMFKFPGVFGMDDYAEYMNRTATTVTTTPAATPAPAATSAPAETDNPYYLASNDNSNNGKMANRVKSASATTYHYRTEHTDLTNGNYIGYCGPDGKIHLGYKVNGSSKLLTADIQVVTPDWYTNPPEVYYGTAYADIEIPAEYGEVEGVEITTILANPFQHMYVYSDASYYQIVRSAGIVDKKSTANGTEYTLQLNTNAAKNGTYTFTFCYAGADGQSQTQEERIYLSQGESSTTYTFTLPVDSDIAITNIEGDVDATVFYDICDEHYYSVSDWSYNFNFVSGGLVNSDPGDLDVKSYDLDVNPDGLDVEATVICNKVHTLGDYKFTFSYNVNGIKKYFTITRNITTTGNYTFDTVIDASMRLPSDTYKVNLVNVVSPDGIMQTFSNAVVYQNDSQISNTFSINPVSMGDSGHAKYLSMVFDYTSQTAGQYTLTFDYDGGTLTRTFTGVAGTGLHDFGSSTSYNDSRYSSSTIQFPEDISYITLKSVQFPDGTVVNCNLDVYRGGSLIHSSPDFDGTCEGTPTSYGFAFNNYSYSQNLNDDGSIDLDLAFNYSTNTSGNYWLIFEYTNSYGTTEQKYEYFYGNTGRNYDISYSAAYNNSIYVPSDVTSAKLVGVLCPDSSIKGLNINIPISRFIYEPDPISDYEEDTDAYYLDTHSDTWYITNEKTDLIQNDSDLVDGIYLGFDFVHEELPNAGTYGFVFDFTISGDNGIYKSAGYVNISSTRDGTVKFSLENGDGSPVWFPATTDSITLVGIQCPDGTYKNCHKEITIDIELPEDDPTTGDDPATGDIPVTGNDPTTGDNPDPVYDPAPVVNNEQPSAKEAFAERLYTEALGRDYDEAGRDYWVSQLKSGVSGADVAKQFFFSEEFINQRNSDEVYVDRLYETFMNRAADAEGKAYWLSQLSSGAMTREDVFNGFINSPEWVDICVDAGIVPGGKSVQSFVARFYVTCLGRESIDREGFNYWVSQIKGGMSGSAVARNFFFSEELTNANISNREYVTRLYRTFLGRNPDATELNDYVSQIANGKSKEEVLNDFAGSIEFARFCEEAGIPV